MLTKLLAELPSRSHRVQREMQHDIDAERPARSHHDVSPCWWAHIEFTRINIEPIILKNKFEDLRVLDA